MTAILSSNYGTNNVVTVGRVMQRLDLVPLSTRFLSVTLRQKEKNDSHHLVCFLLVVWTRHIMGGYNSKTKIALNFYYIICVTKVI